MVFLLLVVIIIIIQHYFIWFSLEYTEANATLLMPLDTILPEIGLLSLALALLCGLNAALLAH